MDLESELGAIVEACDSAVPYLVGSLRERALCGALTFQRISVSWTKSSCCPRVQKCVVIQ